jgi:hypothetical protein
VLAVNIALGNRLVADCSRADVNEDGLVSIDELIRAVNAAINGCVD